MDRALADSTGSTELDSQGIEQAGAGPSQREEDLQDRLRVVERQLAARDAEVATMAQQLGEASLLQIACCVCVLSQKRIHPGQKSQGL